MNYITLETPIVETIVKTYDRFLIKDIRVNINLSATIIVLLKPIQGDIISRVIEISGEDYANWGSDDDYLIQFIKTKLTNE